MFKAVMNFYYNTGLWARVGGDTPLQISLIHGNYQFP